MGEWSQAVAEMIGMIGLTSACYGTTLIALNDGKQGLFVSVWGTFITTKNAVWSVDSS